MNTTDTIMETGCYLDSHRGHYITRDAIELACGYGYIIGGFERFALDSYDGDDNYPHEELQDLCDSAVDWLNSGQDSCPNCTGGINPADGVYWTHANDPDKIKRCKVCTGTGRGPRVDFQNFPPRIPDGTLWTFNDGDFGLYFNHNALRRDSQAMDKIHAVMSGKMWSADTLEDIARAVQATGRKINPPSEG